LKKLNMKMKNAIISYSESGIKLAEKISSFGFAADIFNGKESKKTATELAQELFPQYEAIIYIGSLGICVRAIAPNLKDKKTDPAIINIDVNGNFVQSVCSGHVGGANKLCKELAALLGAIPVISTVSDTQDLWALDLLPKQFGWNLEENADLTRLMAAFVNRKPTALLLEIRDKGTQYLESNCPKHVQVFYNYNEINTSKFDLILAVTPLIHGNSDKTLWFRPQVLHIGVGCQKELPYDEFKTVFSNSLIDNGVSPLSIARLGSAEIKKEEKAFLKYVEESQINIEFYSEEILKNYSVPNPSEKVEATTGSSSVSEAAAMHMSDNRLLIEKTKLIAGNKHFTYAIAIKQEHLRNGFIEFVGAGPGDPELVTVKGKRYLQTADLILYAGSLVPIELTYYAKPGCVVRSSAGLNLQEQVDLMKEFYDRGLFTVRLHTGDPCIYGAIQEQMNLMDKMNMKYHITPGVSSFQAAAASLESQFTIPEEVQTIILTRGEGRTPMPEKEKLHLLAKSQSTMCIYLSASIADKVQQDLLEHYPPETPVAACYKLTWKEEKVYRCTLDKLAETIKANNLTMTTLIVVGKAIDNREGESKLYHKNFKHAFRDAE